MGCIVVHLIHDRLSFCGKGLSGSGFRCLWCLSTAWIVKSIRYSPRFMCGCKVDAGAMKMGVLSWVVSV